MEILGLLLLLLQIASTRAIEVAPSSPCGAVCVDQPGSDSSNPRSSSTTTQDLICNDANYENTPRGQKTKDCLSCELNSTYFDTAHKEESDLMWLLFNIKFTVAWCLFGFPTNQNVSITSCTTPCSPLRSAITNNITDFGVNSQYDYCSSELPAPFEDVMNQCATCLAYSSDQTILGKFVSVLRIACEQKPQVGSKLSLSASVFDTSIASSQKIIAQGTNSTSKNPSDPASHKSLNSTAAVVVGLVAGFGLAGTLLGLFFIARRARRRRLEGSGEEHETKDAKLDPSPNNKLDSLSDYSSPPKSSGQKTGSSHTFSEAPADPVGNIPEMQAAEGDASELGITIFSREGLYRPGEKYLPYRPYNQIQIAPQASREIHLPPGGLPFNPRRHPPPAPEVPAPPRNTFSPPRGVPKRKPVPLSRIQKSDRSDTYRSMVSPVV